MKKLLTVLAILMATVTAAFAQDMQIATLSHEGTITSYTSANALRQAYEAAVDGDVITLSSGTFSSVTIEKRITVRGAGMGVKINDSDPYIEPTVIKGVFEVKADGTAANNLKLEGLYFTDEGTFKGIINAQFTKCKFTDLWYSAGHGGYENVTFINCVFAKKSRMSFCFNSTMNFYGCYLLSPSFGGNSLNTFTNCVIEGDYYGVKMSSDCVLKNCIVVYNPGTSTSAGDPQFTAYNTVWTGGPVDPNTNFYKTLADNNNTILPEGTQIFKEGTFYQLTDEAKQYVGSDGTEVGLYGGSLPFDPTPTNPQIVKFNVAPKTTADGKLSVDIEVNAK